MAKRISKSDLRNGEVALEQAIDTFIQGAGKISSALLGMINRAGGQIYALLFLNLKYLIIRY